MALNIYLSFAAISFSACAFAGTVSPVEIREAAVRSVRLVQSSGKHWFETQKCISCHHQAVPFQAIDMARRHGVPVDQSEFDRSVTLAYGNYLRDIDLAVQGLFIVDPAADISAIATAVTLGVPKSPVTAAYARHLARRQMPDGSWMSIDMRPPQSGSLITTASLGIRILQLMMPDSMKAERDERVARARAWLLGARPRDTEDQVARLLGLRWSGAGRREIELAASELCALQAEDGGWRQLRTNPTDAYATGSALYALYESGVVQPSAKVYQRGIRFLLNTQKPDGSWHVRSRVHPPFPFSPPYFETGFPYGHDQFISMAATSHAVMALAAALPEVPPAKVEKLQVASLAPAAAPGWMDTIITGGVEDLRRLLASGFDANEATPGGTTALMAAAPDAEKVKLLIDHGANVNAKAKTRYSALTLAAAHGSYESVRALLDAGAEVDPPKDQPPMFGGRALFWAVMAGDDRIVSLLLSKGADTERRTLLAGIIPLKPFELAVALANPDTIGILAAAGAKTGGTTAWGNMSPLAVSVLKNSPEVALKLIQVGADVNKVDNFGWTPLEWAANIDYGDDVMIRLLLKQGANRDARNKDGMTALEIARKYGHVAHARALERVLEASAGR